MDRAGVETLTVAFQSADKRVGWEKCFSDAKEALGAQTNYSKLTEGPQLKLLRLVLLMSRRPPPVFIKCIAAQRTRAGLHVRSSHPSYQLSPQFKNLLKFQFTCATPTLGRNEYGYPNVWVCNSDGYVGQVCVINLTPEPELSSCNGITNSRILCVCAVPDAK